jgi:phosphoribosyl 1,2-cyclic phosphodiesterase
VTLEILILASGSSGNSALVCSGGTAVLVDVGVSALQVRRRLESFGRTPEMVDAILLTHEHSDHVCGLDVFVRRHRAAPVWATPGTWSEIDVRCAAGGELCSGTTRRFGELRVTPVATSHDASEPVAFVFDDGHHSAALCTDTGIVTTLLEQRLRGCELLLLESNHDKDLLRHGPYPWPLKQRIDSITGHLSNHQSGEAVERLRSSVLRGVVGLHLSAENNSPTLVREGLAAAAGSGVEVAAATRGEMLRVEINSRGAVIERRDLPPARTGSRLEPRRS